MKKEIAYQVADALRSSEYHIAASGFRGVGRDELALLIRTIAESTLSQLEENINGIYKYHPDTIELDRCLAKMNCEQYDGAYCDCFLPDVEHEDCWCRKQRKAYLETTDYRNTPEYREWRKAVFERDKHTCQDCSKVGGELNAHHIKKYKDYPKDRYRVENGITLCVECHRARHKNEK